MKSMIMQLDLLDHNEMWCIFCQFSWYCLQVNSIRDAAANNVKRLAEEFGPEWAMQHIIPQVLILLLLLVCMDILS